MSLLQGGALATNDASSNTLRTATGSYMRVRISNATSNANSTGSESTRRLLAADDDYTGLTISRSEAAKACQYLSEGTLQYTPGL